MIIQSKNKTNLINSDAGCAKTFTANQILQMKIIDEKKNLYLVFNTINRDIYYN